MPQYHYTSELENPEEGAKAVGTNLSISHKHSVEICRYVKDRKVEEAKSLLDDVISKDKAVPYKRYNRDQAHKKGMAAGRYPVKAAKEIKGVIESVESNADDKGLNADDLVITHIAAQKADQPSHGGRKRGQEMKRAHVEVFVEEK